MSIQIHAHKYWQADWSLLLPSPRLSPGSDCWPWWTCHVCPWPRTHGTFTTSCPLLWCQRSAVLQTKSSKRTCYWSSYPRQPRAAASHDPLLFNGWVDLQWTRGWPFWRVWVFFLFLSVWMFWMGMNMIISGHAGKYVSCSLCLCWVLWSYLTRRLHHDLDFSIRMTGSDCQRY